MPLAFLTQRSCRAPVLLLPWLPTAPDEAQFSWLYVQSELFIYTPSVNSYTIGTIIECRFESVPDTDLSVLTPVISLLSLLDPFYR